MQWGTWGTWQLNGDWQPSGIERLDLAAEEFAGAFEHCVEQGFKLPSVLLPYCWIDSMGALYSSNGRATRKTFCKWIEQFGGDVLTEFRLSADDIYSARCGIAHALSHASDMTRNGSAKTVAYTHGSANPATANMLIARTGLHNRLLFIHVRDLGSLAYCATVEFFRAISVDPGLAARCDTRVKDDFFASSSVEEAEAILRAWSQVEIGPTTTRSATPKIET